MLDWLRSLPERDQSFRQKDKHIENLKGEKRSFSWGCLNSTVLDQERRLYSCPASHVVHFPCVCPHPHHAYWEPATHPAGHQSRKIHKPEGVSLMNYQQVACQQETWIGLENPHTMPAFLKKVWLWEGNKDAWTRGQHWKEILIGPCWGAELEWVRVWCQKVPGCGKPLTVLMDQNKSSIYF